MALSACVWFTVGWCLHPTNHWGPGTAHSCVHSCVTSDFFKLHVLLVSSDRWHTCTHFLLAPLVPFKTFLLGNGLDKSIARLLCMRENFSLPVCGDRCLEQHNILPMSVVSLLLCHQKDTAGLLYLHESVIFRSLLQTPGFANLSSFLFCFFL